MSNQDSTSKELYGRNISSQKRKDLKPRSLIILDIFEGFWAQPNGQVFLTNKRIAEELGCSVGTVGRCIKELSEKGYIQLDLQNKFQRYIYPGGLIIHGRGLITSDQGVDHPRSGGLITSDQHKLPNINNGNIKEPSKLFPSLYFSQEEKEKLIKRYRDMEISLREGMELLTTWAEENPKAFAKKKSHYRILIGWVEDRLIEKKIKKLNLERSEMYHENAMKSGDRND